MKNDYISDIHEKDKLILHPYQDLKYRGTYNRKLIIKSENIYLYDEDGKRYIDGREEPLLWNVVDKRNRVHMRLLKFLGFKFLREFPYGPNQLTFIEFAKCLSAISSSFAL